MNRRKIAIKRTFGICTALFLFSVLGQSGIFSQTADANAAADWVVMLYLDGDNLLSSALQQRVQTLGNIGSNSNVKVAILADYRGDGDTVLYYLEGTTLEQQDWETESDMTDPATLTNFADKVLSDIPANHVYLAITSNKGSGWQGVCWDDHSNDGIMITMPELLSSLNDITDNGANKIDVLHIESCLCGNFELRYQVHSCCDYFVGYADCGIVNDVSFPDILNELKNSPLMTPESLATTIVNYFSPYYDPFQKMKTAIGATESGKLDELKDAINNLALIFMNNIDAYKSDISNALSQNRMYGYELWDISFYIDLQEFLQEISNSNPEFISARTSVINAINDAVIAKKHLDDDYSCGFNFYFPKTKGDYNYAFRYDDGNPPSPYEETQFAIDTQWDEFLKIFLGVSTNQPPNNPSIDGPSRGKSGQEYNYTFSANDPDDDRLVYTIDWGDGATQNAGPYESGEQIIISHMWNTTGTYSIRVKVQDEARVESGWTVLEVSMPKTKSLAVNPTMLLIGTVLDVEKNQDGDFKFLPMRVLSIGYTEEEHLMIDLLTETKGEFPCCSYIDIEDFHGLVTSTFICGIWKVK